MASTYLKKGSLVYVEGRLKTKKWDDKNGAKKSVTEIHASVLQMLDNYTADGNTNGGNGNQEPVEDNYTHLVNKMKSSGKNVFFEDEFNDDIPF